MSQLTQSQDMMDAQMEQWDWSTPPLSMRGEWKCVMMECGKQSVESALMNATAFAIPIYFGRALLAIVDFVDLLMVMSYVKALDTVEVSPLSLLYESFVIIVIHNTAPIYYTSSQFGDGGRPLLNSLDCNGYEENISLCSNNSYLSFLCPWNAALGVRCRHGILHK